MRDPKDILDTVPKKKLDFMVLYPTIKPNKTGYNTDTLSTSIWILSMKFNAWLKGLFKWKH